MLQCPTSPTATTFPSNSAPASTGCTRFARNQSPSATHSQLISAWLRRNSWNEIDPSQRVATAQGEREEANVGGRIEIAWKGALKGAPFNRFLVVHVHGPPLVSSSAARRYNRPAMQMLRPLPRPGAPHCRRGWTTTRTAVASVAQDARRTQMNYESIVPGYLTGPDPGSEGSSHSSRTFLRSGTRCTQPRLFKTVLRVRHESLFIFNI